MTARRSISCGLPSAAASTAMRLAAASVRLTCFTGLISFIFVSLSGPYTSLIPILNVRTKPGLSNPRPADTVRPMSALAPYASRPEQSRGRLKPEPESPMRSVFQRDRDRILHSTAFRRLKHKTQVFVYHEGDHYRTRLTHSLEVAQIARTIARALGLDEDLAEALALAHDLGHTPFGHAGEEALHAAMKPFGGFDHNAH